MDHYTSSTAGKDGTNQSSVGAAESNEEFSEMLHYSDREHDIGVSGVDLTANSKQHEVKDTDVAEGTASLGRAAQPPPSEKSSTLDAKDSKRPLFDEEASSFDMPPGQSESAASSSALLVTGAIQGRRRLPRHAPVSILDYTANQPPFPPSLAWSLDHSTPPLIPSPGYQPRPSYLWATANPTADSPPSPMRDSAPPVPPKTYLKTMPQATTTPDHEAPPLPQCLYLPENEEARGLEMSIEELGCAGVSEALTPLEGGDTVVQSAKPSLASKGIQTQQHSSLRSPRDVHREELFQLQVPDNEEIYCQCAVC